MSGPRQDELVFATSNTIKTDVRFKTKHRYGKVKRFFVSFVPNRGYRRKIKKSRKMVTQSEVDIEGWEGVCAAMSGMYLQKSHELGNVTRADHISDTFKLGIAQCAFEKTRDKGYSYSERRERLLDSFQLNVIDSGIEVTLFDVMQQVYDTPGRYMVALRYESGGGHMIALRNAGGPCFYFDPDQGLYRFASRDRFWEAVWTDFLGSDLTEGSTSSWWLTQLQ